MSPRKNSQRPIVFGPLLVGALTSLAAACGSDDPGKLKARVIYNQVIGQVVVQSERGFAEDERIYINTRRGEFGQIDCNEIIRSQQPAELRGQQAISAKVPLELLTGFYGPEWAEEPTPAMMEALKQGTRSMIDVCRVIDGDVVESFEEDLFVAWDAGKKSGIGGKADDPSGEETYRSQHEYAERCVEELGEIPFFPPTDVEGEYGTYHCTLGLPNAEGKFPEGYEPPIVPARIPVTTTVIDENGQRITTNETESVSKCDKPQYLYSSCEAGPTVSSAINEEGTRWVLLCRKDKNGKWDEPEIGAEDRFIEAQYNDIAMIGHNPTTGKTCFIQNALYQQTDGARVPHPADDAKWQTLWDDTVHGALGSGIECAKCHDSDPFIHSPWIDGAKTPQGQHVVPKIGEDPAYPLGANDAPYSIVNTAGQGWTMPEQVVSEEANACLRCHRIGSGKKWIQDRWFDRLTGDDSSYLNMTTEAFRDFHSIYWMPPDLRAEGLNEDNIDESEFGKALAFLQNGCVNCEYAPLPTNDVDVGGGPLFEEVDMSDSELALAAAQHLGAEVEDSTGRCSECHSLTQRSLRRWEEMSNDALLGCLNPSGPGTVLSDSVPSTAIAQDAFQTFGPYQVPEGGTFEVTMDVETGDADLYVKKNSEVSESDYDCRPYSGGQDSETCGPSAGPGTFYVGVHGYQASNFSLKISYTGDNEGTRDPRQVVNCMRVDRDDEASPFDPNKIGIFSGAAHLGYFADLFQAAYPNVDWREPYSEFKQRIGMPKGNHPKMTQEEFNIVATWFKRGLPRLESTIPEDSGVECNPYIGPELTAHIDEMALIGWEARNREEGLEMYGCTSGGTTIVDETLFNQENIALTNGGGPQQFGPFELGANETLVVNMEGTNDADLYVRLGSAPTEDDFDCRPYSGNSNETCTQTQAGSYFVMLSSYSATSNVDLSVVKRSEVSGGGSGEAVEGIDCLADYPRASEWEFSGSTIRELRTLNFRTSFWSRSSADGRYVAHGGSWISDLERGYDIPVDANYDPAFYPDNSGFIFHGTPIDGSGGAFCAQSLLDDEPEEINFTGLEECSSIANIATYQHLGKGLDEGSDYFIINSPFTSDDGGHYATTSDPSASYSESSEIRITPMVNVGGRYEAGQVATFPTPFEGDSVLSPSTRLVAGHIGDDNGRPVGYVIRKLHSTRTEDGYEIDAPEIARICSNGTKPAFSYDERFLVFHHYVEEDDYEELGFDSASDPGFQEYLEKGAANLFLVDLATGVETRITDMPAGQYALFPHFRADGWIYFLVRNPDSESEKVGASDAALRLGQNSELPL